VTLTITGDQVWSVGKYALAVVAGGAAVFLAMMYAASKAFERWW
jgi:hypothetical protein